MQRKDGYKSNFMTLSLISILLVLPVFIQLSPLTTARTLTVSQTNPTHYKTIQAAINTASNGDIITISEGDYTENLVISKSIELIGENKKTTRLFGTTQDLNIIIHVKADQVHISGLTLAAQDDTIYSCGILLNATSNCTIRNITIKNCTEGMKIWGDSILNTIYHTNFLDNIRHAVDQGKNTKWDNGYPDGGNYWDHATGIDEYSGKLQNQEYSDGIYDNAYVLTNTVSSDHFPFTTQDGWLNTPPTAHAGGPYIGYINNPLVFDGSQSYDQDGPLSYQWDFGDGTTNNGQYPHHTYTQPGTYHINITVSDSHNVTKTETTEAYIWNQTTGSITLFPSDDSYLTQNTTAHNHTNKSYLAVSNQHGKNSSEWEHITLIRFNLSSLPAKTTITKATLSLYYYDFEKTNPRGRTLTLHETKDNWYTENATWAVINESSDDIIAMTTVPSAYSYLSWDVTESVQQFVAQHQRNHGWHIRDLIAWNDINIPIIKFKSKETTTTYKPQLSITYYTPLQAYTNGPYYQQVNQTITLKGYHLGSGTTPYTWKWTFGDGTQAKTQNTQHTYQNPGQYKITLTLTDKKGNTTTYNTTATIVNDAAPTLTLTLTTPDPGIYIYNQKIIPLRHSTLVVGPLDITATVNIDQSLIKHLEFYLDGQLMNTDTTAPYQWTWNTHSYLKKHTLTINAYTTSETTTTLTYPIWKIL